MESSYSSFMLKRTALLLALVSLFLLGADSGGNGKPAYTKDGKLMFPADYRNWTFVTSGVGMTYGPAGTRDAQGNPMFDNVFANTASYRQFLKTGSWPDKTQLVLEIRNSDSKASINKDGHFQTKTVAVEVHVKDASKGGWAFYGFRPGASSSEMTPKTADCYSCHERNGAVDTTFVQFYPTLQEVAHEKGTFKAGN
jgi:Cytochrome P460